jgi:hypothetical protein
MSLVLVYAYIITQYRLIFNYPIAIYEIFAPSATFEILMVRLSVPGSTSLIVRPLPLELKVAVTIELAVRPVTVNTCVKIPPAVEPLAVLKVT